MSEVKKDQPVYFYYKVAEDSERGKKIVAFLNKCKASVKRSSDLAKELGAACYAESPNAVFPGVGIGSLGFRKPQSQRVYRRIGRIKGIIEYIPVASSPQGKEILNKILKLNLVCAVDLRNAFGIPDSETRSASYFRHEGSVYVRCRYELGEDFEPMDGEEYEVARKRKEWEDAKVSVHLDGKGYRS